MLKARFTTALLCGWVWAASPALAQTAFQGSAQVNASIQAPARAAQCAACHGAKGVSQIPSIPSLAAQPKTFIENQLVLIREGLRDVPAMKGSLDGVPDAELGALATYFSAQAAPPAAKGRVDKASLERGRELAKSALCGTCHLPQYQGRDQVPRLASQQEQFLLDVMKEYRDKPGPGRDTVMAAALYGINDTQLKDLAHFFAHTR
ncbi:MAG: c-type cytochrome [Limnohabitans sp.]|uniref:c-type cytochrome n=1 Tax=Limnohabitans sp. TaxID=1907725 RepID=UPI00391B4E3E